MIEDDEDHRLAPGRSLPVQSLRHKHPAAARRLILRVHQLHPLQLTPHLLLQRPGSANIRLFPPFASRADTVRPPGSTSFTRGARYSATRNPQPYIRPPISHSSLRSPSQSRFTSSVVKTTGRYFFRLARNASSDSNSSFSTPGKGNRARSEPDSGWTPRHSAPPPDG